MDIITHRRNLHQIPELELNLPRTAAYIRQALAGLNCRVFCPVDTAVFAFFDFGADHAIAFRADMDALPIEEKTGAAYGSRHPGVMHACGHDGHMAILLELARRLNQRNTLAHNVLLVFQPGEESPGGAKPLCDTGLLEEYKVKALFGLHIWPGLAKGKIFSRENELMSRSCEVDVDVYGRSAHIAKAAEGMDALAAGLEFYRRATAMEQALPPEIFRLLKFGRMESGTVRNAISAHTHLEGSLRAFQDEVFEGLRECLYKIAAEVGRQFGCTVEVSMNDGYPAVLNPSELFQKVRSLVNFQVLDQPSMTSEDFSWYQKYMPGMFFFLGLGDTPALHTSNFDFDASILTKGADFFEELADKYQ